MEYCKNYQNVTQRHEVGKHCWKMAPIDVLEAELPESFHVLKKRQYLKPSKVKHNKTR